MDLRHAQLLRGGRLQLRGSLQYEVYLHNKLVAQSCYSLRCWAIEGYVLHCLDPHGSGRDDLGTKEVALRDEPALRWSTTLGVG